ncbi:hypothetical protein L5515_005684 [Caenorhabditis briggsae]|uniref:Uncharacterized protein n=1 Tax=Caenorhabditis briggsae TaxID=6238 RepID=A0AAE9F2H8_CAEBR|nr:hypothetical protein L3Y34_005864 [Caenorhabditis briggsae]UMM31515.1 hypothetical protein L5515_005684 [Caenorhabditis briggsae]
MTTPDFGEATYVSGRHGKNPVLVYTSRTDRNKVYEFMIACRYKIPGLVSWKCVSCTKVKNGYRNLGEKLTRKVPLILVDNDIIKENPEKPLNAEHFCNGKDAVDAVLDRARIEFVHRHGDEEPNSLKIRQTIQLFAREAAATAPVPLNLKEKRHVQRQLDAKCLPLLHGVQKRRRRLKDKEASLQESNFQHVEEEETHHVHEQQSTSSDPHLQHSEPIQSPQEVREEIEDSADLPRKKARRLIKHPQYQTSSHAVMVRPLPPAPYYYQPSIPSRHDLSYQYQQHHQNQVDYYDNSEDVHQPVDDNDDLISGDQQQVAYSIEL